MTLLIADDSERIREMLKNIVSGFFSKIFECGNGKDAIELFRQNNPDWTLMDIEMPLMDGITATKKITETNPEAKIIIVTNHDSTVLRKNAEEAGAVKYILKENSDEILDLINQ